MRPLVLGLLVACGDNGANEEAPPAQLLAWYPMDDLVDGRASDVSGNGHHGSCTACPSLVIDAGHSVNAFRFDGTQEIAVPADPAFQTTDGVTVEVWVWLDAAPLMTGCPIKKGASWHVCITPQRMVEFDATLATMQLALGAWHEIVASWDGVTQRVRIDGVEVAAHEASLTFDTTGLTIGRDFVGIVDDPRIYAGVTPDR